MDVNCRPERAPWTLAIAGAVSTIGMLLATWAPAHEPLTFSDVQPILAVSCGGSECHINQTTSGVNLTSHESLMASVGEQYGGPIVIPYDPAGSPLLEKITSATPRFGERMPRGEPALLPEHIDTLWRWVRDGALSRHRPLRGDGNGDEALDLTDAVFILSYLFRGGQEPPCLPQVDANADGLHNLTDAVHVLMYLFRGGDFPGELTEDEAASCEEVGELSFQSIYEKVFAVSCAFSQCHSSEARKANLALGTLEEAHASLVGVEPDNPVAAANGMLRVEPGVPDNSFLLRKLTEPGPGEGNRMPANSPVPLSDGILSALREWILAGAPLEGTIEGVPDITDDPPPPIDRMPPPPVPENGIQMHLPPFSIGPHRERQIHYFMGAPFADLPQEEIWVQRIDIHMMEQSHHFILYHWVAGGEPRAGIREGSFVDINNARIVAVSQQSFFSLVFPQNVGLKFDKDAKFDFNSHYINLNGEQTLLGEVYVNIFFGEPESITTEVKPIFDFGGNIFVPPDGEEHTARGLFPNGQYTRIMDPSIASTNGRVSNETHIYALTSHTHRPGVHFDVHRTMNGGSNLDKVYETFSWDDPDYTIYDPPLVLQPGEGLRYEATYVYDDPPFPGAPPLTWGNTSEDEMIILLGYYAIP